MTPHIILESWEIIVDFDLMTRKIGSLKAYSEKDFQNNEFFYKNAISTFVARVLSLDVMRRQK